MKRPDILWPRLLCEPYDDATPCPVRVIAAIATVVYHIGIVYAVVVVHTSIGFSELNMYLRDMALLTGVTGPALGVKSYMRGDAPEPGERK